MSTESETEVAWTAGEPLLSDQQVRAAVAAAASHGDRPGIALSVVFVDDEYLTRLHAEHLDDPTSTDVITFDLGADGPGPSGELYVSVERAQRVAAARGISVGRELTLYVVHGTLHLSGFDDRAEDDRARMRAAEATVLAALGFAPDESAHEFGVD